MRLTRLVPAGVVLAAALAMGAVLHGAAPARGGAPLPDGVPQRFQGEVSQVVDGDTVVVAGLAPVAGAAAGAAPPRVRLALYDAPEHDQRCRAADGSDLACGRDAALRLATLIQGQIVPCRIARQHGVCLARSTPIACETMAWDRRWGRIVARCAVGGTDIATWMVGQGYARAFGGRRPVLGALEAEARAARRGYWAGAFDDPGQFRDH